MTLISADIPKSLHAEKKLTGISWKGLIIRGIRSVTKNTEEEERNKDKIIDRLQDKLREQGLRIYKLETKEEEKE